MERERARGVRAAGKMQGCVSRGMAAMERGRGGGTGRQTGRRGGRAGGGWGWRHPPSPPPRWWLQTSSRVLSSLGCLEACGMGRAEGIPLAVGSGRAPWIPPSPPRKRHRRSCCGHGSVRGHNNDGGTTLGAQPRKGLQNPQRDRSRPSGVCQTCPRRPSPPAPASHLMQWAAAAEGSLRAGRWAPCVRGGGTRPSTDLSPCQACSTACRLGGWARVQALISARLLMGWWTAKKQKQHTGQLRNGKSWQTSSYFYTYF